MDLAQKRLPERVGVGDVILETGRPFRNTLPCSPWSCGGFPRDKVDIACGHRVGRPIAGFLRSRFFLNKSDFGGNFMEDINRDSEVDLEKFAVRAGPVPE